MSSQMTKTASIEGGHMVQDQTIVEYGPVTVCKIEKKLSPMSHTAVTCNIYVIQNYRMLHKLGNYIILMYKRR